MKKFLLVCLVMVTGIISNAQVRKSANGGYGAAISEITWVNGKPSLSLGGYGGWLINHKFLVGAAGQNTFFKHKVNGKKENFQLNYYGLYTEYKLMPERKVHVSFGLTGALGWLENDVTSAQKRRKKDGDFTYVIQPKVGVNAIITKFMQVQAYGSYRITGNTNSLYYSSDNYNGPSAGAALVFGKF